MRGVTMLPQLPPGLCRAGTQLPSGTNLRCGSQGQRSLLEGEPPGSAVLPGQVLVCVVPSQSPGGCGRAGAPWW